VEVTSEGRQAITADDGTIRVWELGSGQLLRTLRGHTDWVSAVAVTSDGQRIVSASWDQTLRMWDLGSGQVLSVLEGHTRGVRALAI